MATKKKKTKGSTDKQGQFQSYKQLLQQQKQAISAVKAVSEQKPEVSK